MQMHGLSFHASISLSVNLSIDLSPLTLTVSKSLSSSLPPSLLLFSPSSYRSHCLVVSNLSTLCFEEKFLVAHVIEPKRHFPTQHLHQLHVGLTPKRIVAQPHSQPPRHHREPDAAVLQALLQRNHALGSVTQLPVRGRGGHIAVLEDLPHILHKREGEVRQREGNCAEAKGRMQRK